MSNRYEYEEISKGQISASRNLVVSRCSKGGFTIAQQLIANEGDRSTTVFMKGAFHIDDLAGLYEARNALTLAIEKVENGQAPEEDWD